MTLLLLSILACGAADIAADDVATGDSGGVEAPPADDSGEPIDTGETGTNDTSDTGERSDTGGAEIAVDVLVIGAGPAGLAAGWEASLAGASVAIVEREAIAGGSGWHGGSFFAAGSRFQAERGIDDSVEAALDEWASFTDADPDDPWVRLFLERSAETVEWMVDEWGAALLGVGLSVDQGSVARTHAMAYGEWAPVEPLVDANAAWTWLSHEAVALTFDGERVSGAQLEDLHTGERFEVTAGATVIATGGFGRDPERFKASRPDLAEAQVVFECVPSADGGGHGLLESVGAQLHDGGYGVYAHALEDWEEPGEAVVILDLSHAMIVDVDGQRLFNEEQAGSLDLSWILGEAPDTRLFAIFNEADFAYQQLVRMREAWDLSFDEGEQQATGGAAIEHGGAAIAWELESLAEMVGVDAEGLAASIERYNALAVDGVDVDFGKPEHALSALESPLVAVELLPGVAKAFGGARLDTDARVLDPEDQPIPGLYAAGEVAGILGTPAIGRGLSGSITGVYLTGRIAGQRAAAEALEAR